MISNLYLIRLAFQGYSCESGIAICALMLNWNYAYSVSLRGEQRSWKYCSILTCYKYTLYSTVLDIFNNSLSIYNIIIFSCIININENMTWLWRNRTLELDALTLPSCPTSIFHLYLNIYFANLSVLSFSINVKTFEPIRSTFFVMKIILKICV